LAVVFESLSLLVDVFWRWFDVVWSLLVDVVLSVVLERLSCW
jgi:hypothetical protein